MATPASRIARIASPIGLIAVIAMIAAALGTTVAFLLVAASQTLAQPYPAYPPPSCNASALYDGTATGLQQLVAPQANQRIYVCGYTINVGTASTVQLSYGTGAACGTGTGTLTPAWTLAVNGTIVENDFGGPLVIPLGNALCANITGTTPAVKILVRYLQVVNA